MAGTCTDPGTGGFTNIIVTRKNAETMPQQEWDRFVWAVNKFKELGGYDVMTERHATAMLTLTLLDGETGTSRNVAHRGPGLFPVHRNMVREFEVELIKIQLNGAAGLDGYELDPHPELLPVGVPYWTFNLNTTTWRTSLIWSRVGGNGDPNNNFLINTGPFRNWTSRIISGNGFISRFGIVRNFRTTSNMQPFGGVFTIPNYDSSPWREGSSGFRAAMEGKHDKVHDNIRGDMSTPTSPNDPIFWLTHSNVDRAWAIWQKTWDPNPGELTSNFQPYRTSLPEEPAAPAPLGHNHSDAPRVLPYINAAKRNYETFDWAAIDEQGNGYTYESLT